MGARLSGKGVRIPFIGIQIQDVANRCQGTMRSPTCWQGRFADHSVFRNPARASKRENSRNRAYFPDRWEALKCFNNSMFRGNLYCAQPAANPVFARKSQFAPIFSGKKAILSYTTVGGLRLRYDCTYYFSAPNRAKSAPHSLQRPQKLAHSPIGTFSQAVASQEVAYSFRSFGSAGRGLSNPEPARWPAATAAPPASFAGN